MITGSREDRGELRDSPKRLPPFMVLALIVTAGCGCITVGPGIITQTDDLPMLEEYSSSPSLSIGSVLFFNSSVAMNDGSILATMDFNVDLGLLFLGGGIMQWPDSWYVLQVGAGMWWESASGDVGALSVARIGYAKKFGPQAGNSDSLAGTLQFDYSFEGMARIDDGATGRMQMLRMSYCFGF